MRGLELAQRMGDRIRLVAGTTYVVPSHAASSASYLVNAHEQSCTCEDFEERRRRCKHIWAVLILRREVASPEGFTPMNDAPPIKRPTYSQHWPSYNAAQCEERDRARVLLRALCDTVPNPPHPGRGPKPIPLGDVVFAMVMKVYGTTSGRRATSEIGACADAGLISRAPHYNSLFAYFEKPEMTEVLSMLLEQSAAPLATVETCFAADSTGFSTSVYRRWFDHKYGRELSKQTWVKAHAMVGVATHVITAVTVLDETSGDSPELRRLLSATATRFEMKEISADKAYLSHENLAAIESFGARPFIPLKLNSRSDGSPAWKRLAALFTLRHEEFLEHYHARSNVESVFSAIKRKFGGAVRSKCFVAQVNEVLAKCIAFNLTMLVHAMHEIGIEPTFQSDAKAVGA